VTDAGRYFAMDPSVVSTPEAPGRYVDLGHVDPVEFVAGLEFRPVVGNGLMVNFARYEPNTMAPMHAHEEEQITFVLEGEFEFELDGDVRVMRPGMAVVVPPNVPHGARTLATTCFEVDVFHPPRKVLLEAMGTEEPTNRRDAEESTNRPDAEDQASLQNPDW
jgi:quercetin dioxygenase-like cupin family protein